MAVTQMDNDTVNAGQVADISDSIGASVGSLCLYLQGCVRPVLRHCRCAFANATLGHKLRFRSCSIRKAPAREW